jgi:hypothetical protein
VLAGSVFATPVEQRLIERAEEDRRRAMLALLGLSELPLSEQCV